jgi:hypothetical protein
MTAYYVHWIYPFTADDELFYAGTDDEKLFHKEDNARVYAEKQLKQYQENERRFYKLDEKDENEGLSPEEKEEWTKLAVFSYSDMPYDYGIRKRDIKFEDE